MPPEIEVKFPLRNRPQLIESMKAAGGELLYKETFEDNIVLDRRGELRTKGCLLRVRRFGKYVITTYKGPQVYEDGIKTREEIQTGMESFELAVALFEGLGYKPVFRYQKFREVWRVKKSEVVLDRTPIGDFFEIEGMADEIREIAGEIGMSMDEAIRSSYSDLYRQHRRMRADLPENMVFNPQDLPSV